MNILAIETATEACSAALTVNNEIIQRYVVAPREHASRILGMIDEIMAEADLVPGQLDALAFGRGPGSFIGVRIAASVSQGIAYAADLPVVPVSTLAAIAQGSRFDHMLVAIDARMKEIYWGQYIRDPETSIVTQYADEQLLRPEQAPLPRDPDLGWVGIGTGWQTYFQSLIARLPFITQIDEQHFPTAASVAKIALSQLQHGIGTVTAEQALPVYLRDHVADKPSQ